MEDEREADLKLHSTCSVESEQNRAETKPIDNKYFIYYISSFYCSN